MAGGSLKWYKHCYESKSIRRKKDTVTQMEKDSRGVTINSNENSKEYFSDEMGYRRKNQDVLSHPDLRFRSHWRRLQPSAWLRSLFGCQDQSYPYSLGKQSIPHLSLMHQSGTSAPKLAGREPQLTMASSKHSSSTQVGWSCQVGARRQFEHGELTCKSKTWRAQCPPRRGM